MRAVRASLSILVAVLAIAFASPATAQDDAPPAALIADRIFVAAGKTLVAEGNVQAFQGNTQLTAARISYDRATGRLEINGPIRIDDGENVTILADAAELDRALTNGLLSGARMVLDRRLQMAAVQLNRTDGRYTQLYRTAVTACRVCGDDSPPLWQIRARRVVHDQEERQLYFDDAQLRIMDIPVFWVPHLRLPDPTLDRASGFMIPSVRTTSQLGTGIKVPYFFRLGDHADLTLTPYVSSRTRTLDARYRQAFATGRIAFEGGYTRDDLMPGNMRGYIFADGAFDIGRGYTLSFDIEWTSDNAYLLDYGKNYKDRLTSEVSVSRAKRDQFVRASAYHFNSLRDGEDESLLPSLVFDSEVEQRVFLPRNAGELRLGLAAHAHYRTSDINAVGRDVGRISTDIGWRNSWISSMGLRTDLQFGFAADIFDTRQDLAFNSHETRTAPYGAVTFRLPMVKAGTGGATQYLEPILQAGWSHVSGAAVPVDESGRVEFDQGNLLSLSRFPAPDQREDGWAVAYGLNWARYAAHGWSASLSLGQILRETAQPGFTNASGLSGTSSDFLLAGHFATSSGVGLSARGLFDDNLDFAKAELRGDWRNDRTALGGTYVYLDADPAEGRTRPVSEFNIDGSYDITPHWQASASWRYDLEDDRASTAGIGLAYRNECVLVDLSLNRRYTSSTTVEPSTDFGFTIALRGFGASDGTERYTRSCSNS